MKSFQQIHRIGDRYGIPNALPGESKSKSKNKSRNSLINKAISTKEKYIKRNVENLLKTFSFQEELWIL